MKKLALITILLFSIHNSFSQTKEEWVYLGDSKDRSKTYIYSIPTEVSNNKSRYWIKTEFESKKTKVNNDFVNYERKLVEFDFQYFRHTTIKKNMIGGEFDNVIYQQDDVNITTDIIPETPVEYSFKYARDYYKKIHSKIEKNIIEGKKNLEGKKFNEALANYYSIDTLVNKSVFKDVIIDNNVVDLNFSKNKIIEVKQQKNNYILKTHKTELDAFLNFTAKNDCTAHIDSCKNQLKNKLIPINAIEDDANKTMLLEKYALADDFINKLDNALRNENLDVTKSLALYETILNSNPHPIVNSRYLGLKKKIELSEFNDLVKTKKEEFYKLKKEIIASDTLIINQKLKSNRNIRDNYKVVYDYYTSKLYHAKSLEKYYLDKRDAEITEVDSNVKNMLKLYKGELDKIISFQNYILDLSRDELKRLNYFFRDMKSFRTVMSEFNLTD